MYLDSGKIKFVTYDLGDSLVLITTDRQSTFDRILTNIPIKGQVLNQSSAFWFENTSDIIRNHVIEIPDPNVTIGKKCKVIPVDFVVRAYLTGSTDSPKFTRYPSHVWQHFTRCNEEKPEVCETDPDSFEEISFTRRIGFGYPNH